MADVNLAVETINRAGLNAADTALATADDYFFPNDGRTFVHLKKTGANPANVTFVSPATRGGLAVADLVVVVPATTGDLMVGPFPPGVFGSTVEFATDEETAITAAVVRLP